MNHDLDRSVSSQFRRFKGLDGFLELVVVGYQRLHVYFSRCDELKSIFITVIRRRISQFRNINFTQKFLATRKNYSLVRVSKDATNIDFSREGVNQRHLNFGCSHSYQNGHTAGFRHLKNLSASSQSCYNMFQSNAEPPVNDDHKSSILLIKNTDVNTEKSSRRI